MQTRELRRAIDADPACAGKTAAEIAAIRNTKTVARSVPVQAAWVIKFLTTTARLEGGEPIWIDLDAAANGIGTWSDAHRRAARYLLLMIDAFPSFDVTDPVGGPAIARGLGACISLDPPFFSQAHVDAMLGLGTRLVSPQEAAGWPPVTADDVATALELPADQLL